MKSLKHMKISYTYIQVHVIVYFEVGDIVDNSNSLQK